MEELFPLLFIIFVWSLVGSTFRKMMKNAKNKQPSSKKRPSAAPEKKPIVETRSSHQHAAPDWGSMGGSSSEGVDPCHDDPYGMPLGSLSVSQPEGTDPCHDDPRGMPLGSLAVDHPEGTDPCHPAFRSERPDSGIVPDAEGSGLNLRFGGSDIVHGFVWGEILNRKRA